MSLPLVFRTVIQRAKNAEVFIDERSCGGLKTGLVLFFGVGIDSEIPSSLENSVFSIEQYQSILEKFADKIIGMRIFCDSAGKMNLSVRDVGGGLYIVSQFTLFADCRKGFRPGFSDAAPADNARSLYHKFIEICRQRMDLLPVYTGEFGADMKVALCNDGPVTILLDASSRGIR